MLNENEYFFSIPDKYPMTDGHLLIIPKRHFESIFEIKQEEWNSVLNLINDSREYLVKDYSPSGYNIGINVGSDAGQSVFHAHIHLIPRYRGDMDDGSEKNNRINIPLFEFMRDNDIFKKVILDQFAQRKIDEINQRIFETENKENLSELKRKLREFADGFCDKEDISSLKQVFEIVERILANRIGENMDK